MSIQSWVTPHTGISLRLKVYMLSIVLKNVFKNLEMMSLSPGFT
jgi:hypothetical protein